MIRRSRHSRSISHLPIAYIVEMEHEAMRLGMLEGGKHCNCFG